MAKEQEFNFTINWPKKEIATDDCFQIFSIEAQFPSYHYRVPIKDKHRIAEDAQRRLAISELKVRLIQDIANAEFVLKATR